MDNIDQPSNVYGIHKYDEVKDQIRADSVLFPYDSFLRDILKNFLGTKKIDVLDYNKIQLVDLDLGDFIDTINRVINYSKFFIKCPYNINVISEKVDEEIDGIKLFLVFKIIFENKETYETQSFQILFHLDEKEWLSESITKVILKNVLKKYKFG